MGQHQEKRLSMKKKTSTKLHEAMNSHCSALMSRLGHRSWRSPVWSGVGCGRSLPGASSDLDAKGNHEPFVDWCSAYD